MWLSDEYEKNDPRLDGEEEPEPNNKVNGEDQNEPVVSLSRSFGVYQG